jgi:predicted tellurium resistance membrane protein TerC
MILEWITDPDIIASLITLTVLEVVLGIDNIVFISVIVSRLPPEQGRRARQIGLALALVFRIVLLSTLFWLIGLTTPVFDLGITGSPDAAGHPSFETAFSWRDLILLAGGLFLLVKGTREIHRDVEGAPEEHGPGRTSAAFGSVVTQIVVIDLVFSVDSIVTAVGIAEHIGVMIAAVIIAVAIMYVASGPVAGFIERHPTTRMLALGFLLMIGAALVADGVGFHIPRAYLYTAMAFSAGVEFLNVVARRNRRKPTAT